MEDSFPNQIWPIQMPHYVLQTLQFPGQVPNHDEHDLPQSHHRTSHNGLHGRYPGLYQNYGRTSTSHHSSNANIVG